MLCACTTPQNSMTNNNTPPPPPAQNQVANPTKPSSKYQKYKSNDKLMAAPAAAMEKESVQMVRDTM